MEPGPLVSIVTPTYQRAALLRHTMASVRSQTYPRIEHIVVDGASTDGTIELLAGIADRYPMRWISEPDEGMFHAINKGLGMARGEIMAYLNSDDLYFPWTVRAVVDAFARHTDAGFVYGDALLVDDVTGETDWRFSSPFDLDFIQRVGVLIQPTVFWRRSAFEDVGPFDERLRFVADCDYWMRAGTRHRFVRMGELLAVERNHQGTLREAESSRVWPELARVRARYVTTIGPEHERMMRRHAARSRLYSRLFRTMLWLQVITPRAFRRGPWRRSLGSGHLVIDRRRLFALLIPRLGSRLSSHRFVLPSRYWLEPQ
jgi:glycosyltransferase involved in cell wall biosynthesis